MCLSKLENFKVTQNYGWQVFKKNDTGELYGYYFGYEPIPIGEWQKDKFRIRDRWIYTAETNARYKKGFHIFLEWEDVKKWFPGPDGYCIKKVRFEKVVAQGLQDIGRLGGQTQYARVVICHKRFIEQTFYTVKDL